jgi:hypothetical protein
MDFFYGRSSSEEVLELIIYHGLLEFPHQGKLGIPSPVLRLWEPPSLQFGGLRVPLHILLQAVIFLIY